MKQAIALCCTLLGLSSPIFASESEGAESFQFLCANCHVTSGQGTIAPPVFGMVDHVKRTYPNREDFVNYVVNWVPSPDASKALMPGAVKKFGLMPALPYDSEQVRQIAEFLYDNGGKMPDWYAEHYQQEHGKGSMNGQGKGKN
ncbi:cytochrome c [Maribrevibacterium harenarium]|uniref:Cytochrome c n=1 Tax=Maribrevibacterium harenarium TaxID=2589817 RepID=A0A501WZM3_9GAMM|nr:cytochrome c [Maribrevibacterium harenarium]TPE51596.1 cytochrome c [Maribrevibacterium harenarium]